MDPTRILIYVFGALVFLIGVPFLIVVMVVIPIVFGTRESLRRNSMRGFFRDTGSKMHGPLILVLPIVPLILVCYLFVAAIVALRLVLGGGPGVTSRHVKSLMIGAVVGTIVTGLVAAFLVVPIMKASGGEGWLEARGFGGVNGFLFDLVANRPAGRCVRGYYRNEPYRRARPESRTTIRRSGITERTCRSTRSRVSSTFGGRSEDVEDLG